MTVDFGYGEFVLRRRETIQKVFLYIPLTQEGQPSVTGTRNRYVLLVLENQRQKEQR
ncbi:hypothetical protein DPMN_177832 [Dreissena polymorpha]|uniref:Uncharacterized protein n=1 Tax=Dreissena polymorpha TaxID=45954 RepID=A0A9D4E9G6_DREPO|nr:hypothetical protein DPMN_177832 [Dreissena polymorpha]